MIILVGGLLVIDGHLSLGGFFTYNLYLALLIWPLRMIGMWIGQYQRAVASGERIFQVLDEHADITDPAEPARAPGRRRRAALRGRDVRLRRRTPGAARPRPRDRAGQHVALIGRTGSGKTTLASLIPRFYDPQAGRVVLDGADVRDLRLADLRGAIATVAEDTFLFSTIGRREHRLRRARRDARGRRRGRAQGAGARVHRGAAARATTRSSASAGSRSRAASASGSRSRARCSSTRAC